MFEYQSGQDFAVAMDQKDPLANFRDQFHIPQHAQAQDSLYFCGNSLGLMPKTAKDAVLKEVDDWAALGVKGYFKDDPWVRFNEGMRASMAPVVGAKPHEVVVMNTLTVNLHLMMVSFYQPTKTRYKILVEQNAFPSDRQAVNSQVAFHGFDPDDAVIELVPRTDEHTVRTEDILQIIEEQGDEIALIMIGAVNFYTGQFFDLEKITAAGHAKNCIVGFDLAHAAGNIPMSMHDWQVDFAVWCNYKYLNGGPACPGGAYVHEKHTQDNGVDLPRFCGWWGEDLEERFKMTPDFVPSQGAAGWQLSNAAVFSLAPVRESLKIFDAAGMDKIREKSLLLTGYVLFLLQQLEMSAFDILTPLDEASRGAQISLYVHENGQKVFDYLQDSGVVCDWRAPGVIRIAPVPLYNSFQDVYAFVTLFEKAMAQQSLRQAVP